MYGGTGVLTLTAPSTEGLSPRVRGNPKANDKIEELIRSIPACTGEPDAVACCAGSRKVYPRVYGGTNGSTTASRKSKGLSPRVRGNRPADAARGRRKWSIPACTGEPIRVWSSGAWGRVYPRVYGGTHASHGHESWRTGLSPRVRGNQLRRTPHCAQGRSIPACTGEPTKWHASSRDHEVYPRVYGGTSMRAPRAVSAAGLSPRVRGNLLSRQSHLELPWSIPACTGEPPEATAITSTPPVYPRVYGGTSMRYATHLQ